MGTLKLISVVVSLAASLQGAVLLIVIYRVLSGRDIDKKRWLLLLIGLMSLTLLTRLYYLFPEADKRYTLLSDLILFFFGPCYFLFIRSVVEYPGARVDGLKLLVYFGPFLLHLMIVTGVFATAFEVLIDWYDRGYFLPVYMTILVLGWVHNIYYWLKARHYLKTFDLTARKGYALISNSLMAYMKWVYLAMIVLFAVVVIPYLTKGSFSPVSYQFAWITGSMGVYGIGYYLLSRPKDFGHYAAVVKTTKGIPERELLQMNTLAETLKTELEENRIFLDPSISLLDLAELLSTNTVTLSRTINHHFKAGFYDLLNQYRVKEFLRLAAMEENRHYTYYALALKAGFNSKTTFNKHFKKVTNRTPRDYFKEMEHVRRGNGFSMNNPL